MLEPVIGPARITIWRGSKDEEPHIEIGATREVLYRFANAIEAATQGSLVAEKPTDFEFLEVVFGAPTMDLELASKLEFSADFIAAHYTELGPASGRVSIDCPQSRRLSFARTIRNAALHGHEHFEWYWKDHRDYRGTVSWIIGPLTGCDDSVGADDVEQS